MFKRMKIPHRKADAASSYVAVLVACGDRRPQQVDLQPM